MTCTDLPVRRGAEDHGHSPAVPTERQLLAHRISASLPLSVTAAGLAASAGRNRRGSTGVGRGAAGSRSRGGEPAGYPGCRGGLSRPGGHVPRSSEESSRGSPRRPSMATTSARSPGVMWASAGPMGAAGKAGTGWSGRGAGRGHGSGPDHRQGSRSWAPSRQIGPASCPWRMDGVSRKRTPRRPKSGEASHAGTCTPSVDRPAALRPAQSSRPWLHP